MGDLKCSSKFYQMFSNIVNSSTKVGIRNVSVNREYILLPVGGQYSLGLVVTGQPVDPALNENQAELGILILQTSK